MEKEKCCGRGESGSATIEAVVSFTIFLLVIFTILHIVRFCQAQAMISSAVDTAAKEMSEYAYLYHLSGLEGLNNTLMANGAEGANNVNEVIGSIDAFYGSVKTAGQNIKTGSENVVASIERQGQDLQRGHLSSIDTSDIENMISKAKVDKTNITTKLNLMNAALRGVKDDPALYISSLKAIGVSSGLNLAKSHLIAAPFGKLFISRQFGDDPDEELKKIGVLGGLNGDGGGPGINLNMSTMFTAGAEDEIHLVAYYQLKVVQLFNYTSFDATMCKESVTRAWLGGDHSDE